MKRIIKFTVEIVMTFLGGLFFMLQILFFSILWCKVITIGKEEHIGAMKIGEKSVNFTIFKGNMNIGVIYFTDKYMNTRKYRCSIEKRVIDRNRLSIGYVGGYLIVIDFEQVREILRVKCSLSDFERLEVFLYI